MNCLVLRTDKWCLKIQNRILRKTFAKIQNFFPFCKFFGKKNTEFFLILGIGWGMTLGIEGIPNVAETSVYRGGAIDSWAKTLGMAFLLICYKLISCLTKCTFEALEDTLRAPWRYTSWPLKIHFVPLEDTLSGPWGYTSCPLKIPDKN